MKQKSLPFKGAAQIKSYQFALQIVNICMDLQKTKKEYILSRQLIKSGTSIGANLEEAVGRQSGKDLLTKLHIAYKEARESQYWIYLMRDSKLITETKSKELINMIEEILKIIGSSIQTLKRKLNYH